VREAVSVTMIAIGAVVIGCGCSGSPASDRSTLDSQKTHVPSITKPPASEISYVVRKDEGEDTPIHSLVRLQLVVSGKVTRENLDSMLRQIYNEKKSGPFKYHPNDPDIALYAYTDNARADSGMGLWIAMLMSSKGDEPEVSFKDGELKSLGKPPTKRFGLTEEQRKKLIWDVTAEQDKNARKAQALYPSDILKQADWQNKRDEQTTAKFRKRNHLSRDQYSSIMVEAVEKNWPLP
jgi:hypothetical protein